jgi:GDPmannose 4,6-dehydratase
MAAARIKLGLQKKLFLGNLSAKRDWGHARDYVEAMWLMLQQPQPDDFVIATGETRSVREFAEAAFREVGIPIEWTGSGKDEQGKNGKTGEVIIEVDPAYYRPTEVDILIGNPAKAREKLGWQAKTTFEELVKTMIVADLKDAEREMICRRNEI